MSEKEDLVLESFLEFLNAVEAGIYAARNRIKTSKALVDSDVTKIKWITAEGPKGTYERCEDVNNLEFKKLLKDLVAHKNQLTQNGYFYWLFQNGTTVGRKKR